MAYPRRMLAMKSGADARQASAAAIWFRASAAARGDCLIGIACARAAFAESLRSTSRKYDTAFFSEIIATCDAIKASIINIIEDVTSASHGGGRSNGSVLGTVVSPQGIRPSQGGAFHGQAGRGKVYVGVNQAEGVRHSVTLPANCAPVASDVWGAA